MKKFLLKSFALIVSVAVLFYTVIFVLLLPANAKAFTEHYQRGFIYQVRALEKAEGKKILTVGASNVAFNMDSHLMGEITGVPAYNLGIHGGMGYCYTLETALKYVGEGDTVLYPFWHFDKDDYGMGLIWLSLEGEQDLISEFVKNHPIKALSTVGQFGLKKIYQLALGNKIDTGAFDADGYRAACFDPETGNYVYERPEPIQDKKTMSFFKIGYTADCFDDGFVSTLRAFVDGCRAKGAQVYFTYHTFMEDGFSASKEEMALLQKRAEREFDVTFLNSYDEVLYPYEYYYNSSTHLNTAGMKKYTETVANALLPYLRLKDSL